MKINDNKQKIYDTALSLFFQKGYTETAISEIIKLTKTNKGTFYHYYENKADLGLQIFKNIYLEHSNAQSFFPDADSLILLALNNHIFWDVFFRDENFRLFITDLHRESIMYESFDIIEVCRQHTTKIIDDDTLEMIVSANNGLRRSMAIHAFDHLESLTFEQPSIFYLKQLFRMFEINKNIIDETLIKSFELFDDLEIYLDRHHYRLSLKQ